MRSRFSTVLVGLSFMLAVGCKLGAGTLALDEADTNAGDVTTGDVTTGDVEPPDTSIGDVATDDVEDIGETGDVEDVDVATDDVADTPDVVACGDCADGDPCTEDQCDKVTGECVHPPAVSAPCDDGSACTSDDLCDGEAQCAGVPIVCDDLDACTIDSCDPIEGCITTPALGTPCDDGNACTAPDRCTSNGCDGTLACDDGLPCTADSCQSGACQNAPITDGVTLCDDGDACTGDDRCGAAGCAGVANDCDDERVCTADSCDGATGTCVNTANVGLLCDDGSACTPVSSCDAAGACVGTVVCDDGKACTADSCQNGTCQNAPITDGATPCDDGDACTGDDRCGAAGCAGVAKACDDGKVCTADSCDGATGTCVNTANVGLVCDDGSACTPTSACDAAGACVGTVVCNDGDPCTADACSGGSCTTTAITDGVTSCSDGDACTEDDRCKVGGCAGTTITCNDGKFCTVDSCLSATGGCSNVPQVGLACDDGDQCTPTSTCNATGICDGPIVCDDSNACTTDSCSLGKCVFTPAAGPCSDGNPCTTESCIGGSCVSKVVCGDRNLGHSQVGRPGVARVGTDGLAMVVPSSSVSVDVKAHFFRSAGVDLGSLVFSQALTPSGMPGTGGAAVGPIRTGGAEPGFWVAHSRSTAGGTSDGSPDIILDGFSTTGMAGLAPQTVNATTVGPQTEPTGVTLPNGTIAIAWTSAGSAQPSITRVVGRFVSQSSGTGITSEFAISPPGYVASAPHMAVGSTGPFAVAMVASTLVANGNGDDIVVGWTSGTASAIGPSVLGTPVVVCGDVCAGAQARPQVAVSRDGSGALVVWESNAGATPSVHGRLLGYDPNTLAVTLPSAAFPLPDSATGTRRLPAVAEWAGGFAVLWRDDALGWVLRRLSPLGVLGPEQTISTALGPTATLSPSLIALQDGSRLVAALPGTADILTLAGLCSPTPTLEDCADDCATDQCMNLSCISNPVGVDCGP